MGRSQLKYRPSRGRGQGDSARGGRGGAGNTTASDSGKPRRSGGRALGSNAFRYEERGEGDAEADDDEGVAVDANAMATRRQFFAGEQNYRDMGEAKESYFRTKAVQRWEAEDDEDDDSATRVATSTVGVMDFAWVAAQLAAVPPSLRYQIDPKYCGDFTFEQPVDDEHREPEVADSVQTSRGSTDKSMAAPVSADVSSGSGTRAVPASTLDDLLALSASTAAAQSVAAVSTPPPVTATPQADLGRDGHENLEEWLDDVLDM